MAFQSPGDVIFSLNGFNIYTYGVIMACACLVGVFTAYYLYKKYNSDLNYNKLIDIAPLILFAGIAGARLYYCLLNPVYYFSNPMEILDIRQGGLSIHGGLFLGITVLILLAKKYNLGCFRVLDSFACGTALAQSIGRWGNFFNSEAFGVPTDLPWKLYIPLSKRPEFYANYEYFHPTFLYESILDMCIFCILLYIMKKVYPNYIGLVFWCYLGLYSIVRFFIEQLRTDSALNIGNIPVAQIVSIGLFTVALFGILFVLNKSKIVKYK